MLGHYKPYFDPSLDAYQEYRKEFVLKTVRTTSNKLQSSSYHELIEPKAMRSVSAWLKEKATDSEKKQFHALFKKFGTLHAAMKNNDNPYTSSSEIEGPFYTASNFGHGVLTEKAIKTVALYFKQNPSTTDCTTFKRIMSALLSYKTQIQPVSHIQSTFVESTPHVVDLKKFKPVADLAAERFFELHKRPKTAPVLGSHPPPFPAQRTTNTNLNSTTMIQPQFPARPNSAIVTEMHNRTFNPKKPYALLPVQKTELPSSKIDFGVRKTENMVKETPAWKATTCPTASGGIVVPSVAERTFQFDRTRKSAVRERIATITKKNQNAAMGKTTYCTTFIPQASIPSKQYHYSNGSKPFGDYGTVDFATEYFRRYNKENKRNYKY